MCRISPGRSTMPTCDAGSRGTDMNFTHTYMCICACIDMHVHAYIHTYTRVCMYTCACMHTHMPMCIIRVYNTCVCVRICMCMHAYVHEVHAACCVVIKYCVSDPHASGLLPAPTKETVAGSLGSFQAK